MNAARGSRTKAGACRAGTAFGFEVVSRDGAARRGRLVTPHGTVDTPAFMSVATFGAVRGVSADELEALGAQILLGNAYHLHERPGEDVI
ncbi:MAG: tRNA-guanine transglycosylase, partial [Proteobacteria bacterium]|nr:tRNA-guanine transglycosylase [Pseudomonadota bacterium]